MLLLLKNYILELEITMNYFNIQISLKKSCDFVESAISNQVKEIALDFAMKASGYILQ
jgi:hypothetical protein